jgi:3-hydroxyacyl-CoA dehydrogenase
MAFQIRKAAVLGSGVMGSGIAAHLANAGIPVIMLDIVPPKPGEGDKVESKAFRNKFAATALANLRKQKPSPIFSTRALPLIEIGNFDDDLKRVGECDWVVEVIKEDLALKNSLFAKLEPLVKKDAIVTSNTSGMSIKGMTEGRSQGFKQRFLVTHFFNPVRYMKLLELVPGSETLPEVMEAMARFGEEKLGKGIVYGKDTTNFIANRIGTYAMMRTIAEMEAQGLTIEEVDKIFGPAMGKPKSAIFRTADLVGLDTLMHVTKNCFDTLAGDEGRDAFKPPAWLEEMVKKGMLGDKSGGGFYKKMKGGEGEKEIQVLDLKTLSYRPQNKVRYDSLGAAKDKETPAERIAAVLGGSDKAARFAEKVTWDALAYASRRLGEIADDYVNIDRAMRWGFAWDVGPFETWDAIGLEKGLARMKELGFKPGQWVEDMVKAGKKKFYETEGAADTYWDSKSKAMKKAPQNPRVITVESLRRTSKPLKANDSASVWNMGDGVLLLEFHSKMNSIDDQITELMEFAVDEAEKNHRGLVIGNDASNFSVGANIGALMMAVSSGESEMVRNMVRRYQAVNQRMRYSAIPVVSAPTGMTLGGGAEATMGANASQAAAETYMGLVEVGVGLIPGGGGTLQLMRNVWGPLAGDKDFDALPFLKKCFLTIGTAKVATSAEEAKEMCFLQPGDGISMSRDLVLADAKARVLGMADSGFRPPRPSTFVLSGRSGAATVDMMLYDMQLNHQISEHDRKIGRKLAGVLTGGDVSPQSLVSEQQILDLELEAFLSLVTEPKTQERIFYMLEKGKPLRN